MHYGGLIARKREVASSETTSKRPKVTTTDKHIEKQHNSTAASSNKPEWLDLLLAAIPKTKRLY